VYVLLYVCEHMYACIHIHTYNALLFAHVLIYDKHIFI